MTRLRYSVSIALVLVATAIATRPASAAVVTRIDGSYSKMDPSEPKALPPPFVGFGIQQFILTDGVVTATFLPSPLSAGGTLSDLAIDLTPFVSNFSPGNTVELSNPNNGSSLFLTMPDGEFPPFASFEIQSATIFSNYPRLGATIRAQVTLEENFLQGIDLSSFAISGGTLTIQIGGASVIPTGDGYIPSVDGNPPKGITFNVSLVSNAVIPEPISAGCWLVGLTAAGWLCRRRKWLLA